MSLPFDDNRWMQIAILLVVDAWILNIVSWTVHMDNLQRDILFCSAIVVAGVALVIAGVNLFKTRKELRRLETKMVVYETVVEIFERLSSEDDE